jgi:methylmalonyl-CoA/ethylmalonyl-CoA epimerase
MAMVKKVDHIGIAVHSIEDVLPFYTDILKLQLVGFEEVHSQQVKVAFLSAGETKIELLEPISDQSAVANFLSKRGEGIHHIAFGVENLGSRLAELKEKGVPLIDETPRKGAAQANIAFLHPQAANKVLVELCEKQRGDENDN